ncbi:MAG: hypothetical protein ACRCYY_15965 [Trueperaceae bacterium]
MTNLVDAKLSEVSTSGLLPLEIAGKRKLCNRKINSSINPWEALFQLL